MGGVGHWTCRVDDCGFEGFGHEEAVAHGAKHPHGIGVHVEGRKDDDGKNPLSLLPGDALGPIAEVLAFGAKKYAPGNWRKVRPGRRYLDAALRHLHAFADGEDNDPESGLSHLAHAGCCVLFAIALHVKGVSVRWEEEPEEFRTTTGCDKCGDRHPIGGACRRV